MRSWRHASRCTRAVPHQQHRPLTTSRALLFRSTGTQETEKIRSINALLERDAAAHDVEITGYVRSVRKQKRVAFAALNDGSTLDSLQAVLKPEDAADLAHGTALKLQGNWKSSQGGKQNYELDVQRLQIQGENDAERNPLQPKYSTPEYLRTIPHLRPRIPTNALLLRLRSQVIASLTHFFNQEDFVQTHTPIVTSSDCEGAGEVFTVSSNAAKDSEQKSTTEQDVQAEHFFRTPKYLTVSAQLHLEALAQAVNKVWTLSPTFRAEKSDTQRHLSEFYMLEAEQCFVHDLEEVMSLVERMLQRVASELIDSKVGVELSQAKEAGDTSLHLAKRWHGMASKDWPRVTYEEAIKHLQDNGFQISYEDGLETEHERHLASSIGKGKPVFVTDYPAVQKPFYMRPSLESINSQGTAKTVACFDLLVPELCELVGGSLREHRSKELQAAMHDKAVAGNNLDWYQDLRKYGSVPHGGFGLGFDRLLCYLSGTTSVRDIVAFPRWIGRCDC